MVATATILRQLLFEGGVYLKKMWYLLIYCCCDLTNKLDKCFLLLTQLLEITQKSERTISGMENKIKKLEQ